MTRLPGSKMSSCLQTTACSVSDSCWRRHPGVGGEGLQMKPSGIQPVLCLLGPGMNCDREISAASFASAYASSSGSPRCIPQAGSQQPPPPSPPTPGPPGRSAPNSLFAVACQVELPSSVSASCWAPALRLMCAGILVL